jgi:hypothetical protein
MVVPAKEKEIPKMWLAVVQDRTQSIFGNYYMDLPSLPGMLGVNTSIYKMVYCNNDLFLSNAKQ